MKYSCLSCITSERVTSKVVHPHDLAGLGHCFSALNSEETLQQWRAFGDTVSNLTRPVIDNNLVTTTSVGGLQKVFIVVIFFFFSGKRNRPDAMTLLLCLIS